MPKSKIFTSPRRLRRMFAGLMSRCTTPISWACASPRATAAPMAATPSGGTAGFFRRSVDRLKPSTYSSTSAIRASVFTKASRSPMFGWHSPASTLASRSSCDANGDVVAMVALSTLRATLRPSGASTAL